MHVENSLQYIAQIKSLNQLILVITCNLGQEGRDRILYGQELSFTNEVFMGLISRISLGKTSIDISLVLCTDIGRNNHLSENSIF